jgi:hypothetical protein
MGKRQIINPLVGFGQRSIGPYANRIGGGTYARHVALRDLAPVAQLHAYGADSNGQLWGLESGDGDLTFARATEASVTDFEGLVRTALVNELRFLYGRRVRNLFLTISQGFDPDVTDNWEWNSGTPSSDSIGSGTGPDGEDTLIVVLNGARMVQPSDQHEGKDLAISVWARATSGTSSFRFRNDASSSDINVDTTWKRYSDLNTATSGLNQYGIRDNVAGNGTEIEFTDFQLEAVTGQADQSPGKYVSVGILSGDYHGVGVDGVAYFNYENGNTVDGNNVVTEANGDLLVGGINAIGDWRALYESFATTNYTLGDDDLSGGAETVDLTASGTGDYTLSVSSDAAVTVAAAGATGTGFGQATAGSPVTFNLSVAGTVTLTLNSGTLDKWDGLAQKQVEKASVASSWVPTSSAAATRSADDGAPSFAFSNWNQTQGTWLADVWFSALNLGSNQGIFSVRNNAQSVLYEAGNNISSNDGTGTSAVALSPVSTDNRFRVVSDFETDDTLEAGMRDVDGEGSWAWDATPANYDGDFATDSVINIAYGVSVPIGIRDLYGYTTRLGKDYIEANFQEFLTDESGNQIVDQLSNKIILG